MKLLQTEHLYIVIECILGVAIVGFYCVVLIIVFIWFRFLQTFAVLQYFNILQKFYRCILCIMLC